MSTDELITDPLLPESSSANDISGNKERKLLMLRKAPIKIEPKVYLANERTFLTWMHSATYLSTASIAIIAYADRNPWSQAYGVMLLPIALGFVVYAMVNFLQRINLIKARAPGPYSDERGPVVLCVLLMISIASNLAIKLYSIYSK
mmetsp:Transcript_21522/g.30841  ORF Transcript_21522/g.30841 Transcript_21522/m.30841 type:complete len:147 (+) Transcript_21522:113-553(+)